MLSMPSSRERIGPKRSLRRLFHGVAGGDFSQHRRTQAVGGFICPFEERSDAAIDLCDMVLADVDNAMIEKRIAETVEGCRYVGLSLIAHAPRGKARHHFVSVDRIQPLTDLIVCQNGAHRLIGRPVPAQPDFRKERVAEIENVQLQALVGSRSSVRMMLG